MTRIVSSLGKGKSKTEITSVSNINISSINISNISNIKVYVETMVNSIFYNYIYKSRWLKLVIIFLLIITGFVEASLLGGFINDHENWISETDREPIEKESNLPIILFTVITILLTILAVSHSEITVVASQNSLMESIIRDQASIIEGQRQYTDILLNDIRIVSESHVVQRNDGSWR